MAFDLATARPDGKEAPRGGFDLSTAKPAPNEGADSEGRKAPTISEVMNSNPNIAKLQKLISAHENSPDKSTVMMLRNSLNDEIAKSNKLETLRQENPYLAEQIESMSDAEKSMVGVGRGMTDIARGLGIAGEEESTEALDTLEEHTYGGGTARTIGQMAPFAPLGGAAAMIPKAVPRAVAMSGLGATEGYTSATGEGVDPLVRTAIGAVAPVLPDAVIKGVGAAGKKISERAAKRADIKETLSASAPNEIIDEIEYIAKSGDDDISDQIVEIMKEVEPKGDKALIELKDAAKLGEDVPAQAVKIINKRRLRGSRGEAAPFRLKDSKIKADPYSRLAIKKGFPENEVQAIKSSHPQTAERNKKILHRVRQGLRSTSYRNEYPAHAIIGDSLLKRINYVTRINKKAGIEVNKTAKALKGEKVSLDEPLAEFMDTLDGLGITIKKKKGRVKLDFDGSEFQGLKSESAPLSRAFDRLLAGGRGSKLDAYDAHKLKGWLDNIIKPAQGTPANKNAHRAIMALRKGVNEQLREAFPAYKKANIKYSETIDPINELRRLAGQNTDLSSEYAHESLASLTRRITSNAMSRGTVKEAIAKIEEIANKHGGEFLDSISEQQQFLNALERKVGSQSDTSLMGQQQSAIEAARNVGGRAAAGDYLGAAAEAVGKATKGAGRASDDHHDLLDAISDLVAMSAEGL